MPYFGIPIRNGLPIGLGSVAGFGIAPFEPYSLFENGEQGAWYDPSDLSTLFTDSAGTVPVTAVEQFVGLMLDKSKGLVLGSNILTNPGPFTTTTGWNAQVNVTLSVETGYLKSVTPGGGSTGTWQEITTVAGKWYQVSGTLKGTNRILSLDAYNGAFSTLLARSAEYPVTGSFATNTVVFQATSTVSRIIYGPKDGNSETYFAAAISVRELPGNHATSTGTKRPKLAARYNLLTYTEQFDNAAWTRNNFLAFGSGSVVNAIAAPNGTVTADLLTESTAASANFFFNQSTVLSASTAYTFSIYCKPNGRSRLYLAGSSVAWGAGFITYNLNTGVVSPSGGSGWTGTIENLPDGWYRITATRTTNAGISGGYVLSLFFLDNAGNVTYTGDGVSGMYFWGADFRPASQATGLIGPTYQRVVDAATYDTVGFLPYLEFNGLSWSMSTGSINPGAVDKAQVFVGLRKLSDATQVIAELSVDANSNNGSIVSYVEAANVQYGLYSKGTNAAIASINSGFAAPNTVVFTGIGDISGDVATLRLNGAQAATSSADQGTGNFLTYPLFIGGRNNASPFFQGWLSSLIVRFGANLTQSQIEATESWVNQKTGAF
jgi:hypothetical protein